jgi:hypothetical protein
MGLGILKQTLNSKIDPKTLFPSTELLATVIF